jgi:hypothetical protein
MNQTLPRLPERHTDFRFRFALESPADVFALLAIVALVGFVIWWFFVRRR